MEEAEDEKTGNGRAAVTSKEGCRNRVLRNRLAASLRPLDVQRKTVSDWKLQEMVGSAHPTGLQDIVRGDDVEDSFVLFRGMGPC